MSLINARQIHKSFAALHLLRRNRIARTFLNFEKCRSVTSTGTLFTRGQQLYFSTSRILKADSETMYEGDSKNLVVSYKDVLAAQNDDNVLIIDVREKDEIDETGKLPGSIHIPMGETVNALTALSDKDFKKKFNRDRPTKSTKIILSCRSGKRSGMVQEEMLKLGYENVYNYGGWLDWEKNHKV